MQQYRILSGTLNFRGVLNDHQSMFRVGLHNFRNEGIGQGGFAGAGSSRHQNIFPLPDSVFQLGFLSIIHDPGSHIITQCKDLGGPTTDGKNRGGHHGRDQGFKASAEVWQFAF